jgi:hypothetical protein
LITRVNLVVGGSVPLQFHTTTFPSDIPTFFKVQVGDKHFERGILVCSRERFLCDIDLGQDIANNHLLIKTVLFLMTALEQNHL